MRFFKLAVIFCILVAAIPESASPFCRACRRARYASSNGAAGAPPSGVSPGARSVDDIKLEAERDMKKRFVEDSAFQRGVALQVLSHLVTPNTPPAADPARLAELEKLIKSNTTEIDSLREQLRKHLELTIKAAKQIETIEAEFASLRKADEDLSAKLDSHFKALTDQINKLAADRPNTGGTEPKQPSPQDDEAKAENPFESGEGEPFDSVSAPNAPAAVDAAAEDASAADGQ